MKITLRIMQGIAVFCFGSVFLTVCNWFIIGGEYGHPAGAAVGLIVSGVVALGVAAYCSDALKQALTVRKGGNKK